MFQITKDIFQLSSKHNESVLLWDHLRRITRKPVFEVFDQVQHKPGCTATEDSKRLEIWIKKIEGLYFLCSENKDGDHLCGNSAADLRCAFVFHTCKKQVFS